MINIIININTKFVLIYKVWFSTVTAFLKIAKLYFSIHFKNYRLINRYRPVWSNLAIGIGKIQYRSTSTYDYVVPWDIILHDNVSISRFLTSLVDTVKHSFSIVFALVQQQSQTKHYNRQLRLCTIVQ